MEPAPAGPSSPQRLPFLAAPDPSVMKLTRGHSCVLCQQRKVRCDKNKPCANCVKAQVECRVVPPQPPRRRKKKPHERELVDRLKKYESLLAQHGVDFDPIGHNLKASDSAAIDEVDEIEHGIGSLKTSPSSGGPDFSSPSGQSAQTDKWFPYYKEFKSTEDMLHDSSDSEAEEPTIHHAFDTMFDNQDGFPFVIGGSTSAVTELHPPGIRILQLWQVYIDNVNPVLKITHTPTLQAQIIEAGADLSKIPKPLEALMFSMYFIAVTSMPDEDCQSMFGEEKNQLLSKYHHGAQQALINAGFMRSPDLIVLQAYTLYLMSVRQYVDPRALYCLIGIAVRIAQRLGLHRDGAQFGLPPFEVEQRRRVWWQLVIFDKRIAEITGSTITALSSSRGDAKWPLNINDTDLHTHAKDPPAPYVGPTEMLFVLTRIEMSCAAAPDGIRPLPTHPQLSKSKFQYSPSPSSPDIVTHVATTNLPVDLEGYCNYIENAYLKNCDPKVPLQFMTLMMTRQNLSKLRVINYLSKINPREQGADQTLRDALFLEAIHMVEYDNVMQSADSLQRFRWYTYMHVPFPAYMFLVNELRSITTGELCERAWAAITENHERRGFVRNLRSPMHIAFGHLFLKAWDAHEAAELQLGRIVSPPKLVTLLRQVASKFKKKTPPKAPTTEAPANPPPKAPYEGEPIVPSMDSTMQDSMLFPGMDMMDQMFNPTGMQDLDLGQIDWGQFMQGIAGYGGFSNGWAPGGYPQAGPGQ